VFSDRLLSRNADGRLFHTVGPWQVKLPMTSAFFTGRHIQSMPTAVEDVLELTLPARTILADMEVRRRGCISIYEDRSRENDPSLHWKPAEAA